MTTYRFEITIDTSDDQLAGVFDESQFRRALSGAIIDLVQTSEIDGIGAFQISTATHIDG